MKKCDTKKISQTKAASMRNKDLNASPKKPAGKVSKKK